MKKIALLIVSTAAFFGVLALIILFAKGWRFNIKDRSVEGTGILAVQSSPNAAKILINGQLRGATEGNTSLPAGTYTLTLSKDGYNDLTRTVVIKPEMVVGIDGFLPPKNPSLSPLTNMGIDNIYELQHDNGLILFAGKTASSSAYMYRFISKNGIFTSGKNIIPLVATPPAQLATDTTLTMTESPTGDQLVIQGKKDSLLIQTASLTKPTLMTDKTKISLFATWKEREQEDERKLLETFPLSFETVASRSAQIIEFSPDKTKVLYEAKHNDVVPPVIVPSLPLTWELPETRILTPGKLYIYDKKEDRNFQLPLEKRPERITWYTDSKRVLYVTDHNTIDSVLYDGSEQQLLYSGPFLKKFFTVSEDGNLIVLLNLNPALNTAPDLYRVSIR